jgi:60 kDa SS-A/Ro ribonucleoprotein
MRYAKHYNPNVTTQTESASPLQVKNSAGGYSFAVDEWTRLERFLILGCEGGSYYASERELTRENAKCVESALALDPQRTISTIVNISASGRAPKNDAAVFSLALAASNENPEVRKLALSALPDVCRIGTHLLQFVSTVSQYRGWGRGLRRAVGKWYTDRNPDDLAYQVLKYQNRGGWSHRDVLRLVHTSPSEEQGSVFRWVVSGATDNGPRTVVRNGSSKMTYDGVGAYPALLSGYERLKRAETEGEVCSLISTYGFTHEMVPNEWKNSPKVWETLLEKMPYTALIRNLAKMTNVGLISPLSEASKLVVERLNNADAMARARVHPFSLLVAQLTYAMGHGVRGSLTWSPDQTVMSGLDSAFYSSFKNVEPTGKNVMIAIDVSGSMGWVGLLGLPTLTPAVAAAAMALTIAKTESNFMVTAFSTSMKEVDIRPSMRLTDVQRELGKITMGGTDCAQPMIFAKKMNLPVDVFATLTDNETWYGSIHPHQALTEYRKFSGRNAKNAVFAMVSNGFSIADPSDSGQMDFVGFDSAALSVFSDFARR